MAQSLTDYEVLDLMAKPVFSIALIVGHWSIDPGRMGLKLRDYEEDPNYFGYKNEAQKAQHEGSHGPYHGNEGVARSDAAV